jgi:heme A synthase
VERASPRVARAANAAAVLAFLTVALGGLTAKLPSAAIACRSFPLCGRDPDAGPTAVHVQLTHRVLALLLLLHLIGVVAGLMRRRQESRTVARAAGVALGLVILQLTVAASMVLLTLPPFLRSLHEAVGVSVWLGTFTYAYLARVAATHDTAAEPSGSRRSATTVTSDPVAVGGSR